jgi:hypothetical protein
MAVQCFLHDSGEGECRLESGRKGVLVCQVTVPYAQSLTRPTVLLAYLMLRCIESIRNCVFGIGPPPRAQCVVTEPRPELLRPRERVPVRIVRLFQMGMDACAGGEPNAGRVRSSGEEDGQAKWRCGYILTRSRAMAQPPGYITPSHSRPLTLECASWSFPCRQLAHPVLCS